MKPNAAPRTNANDEALQLIVCFMHDHLKEVMRVQGRVIEVALLGEDFISEKTSIELRATARLYAGYADQIDVMARCQSRQQGPAQAHHRLNPSEC